MAENSGAETKIDLPDIRDFMKGAESKLPPGMAEGVLCLCEIAATAYRHQKATRMFGSWGSYAQRFRDDLRDLLNKVDFGDIDPMTFERKSET